MSTKHFLCYVASLLALAACGDDDAEPVDDAVGVSGEGGSDSSPPLDQAGSDGTSISGSGAILGGFGGVGGEGTAGITAGTGGLGDGAGEAGSGDVGEAGSGVIGGTGGAAGQAGAAAAGAGGTAGAAGATAGAGGSRPVIPTGDGVAVAQLKGQVATTGAAPTVSTPVCVSGIVDNCANPDSGTVVFTQTSSGVQVSVDIENCYSDEAAGVPFPVRVHSGTSCATPATQGSEWEPALGIPDVVCRNGSGHGEGLLTGVTVGGQNDVVGRVFVLHIPDRWYNGQDRVACGVIEASE